MRSARDSQPRATAAVKAPRTRQGVKVKATSVGKKVRGSAVRPTIDEATAEKKARGSAARQAVEVTRSVKDACGTAVGPAVDATVAEQRTSAVRPAIDAVVAVKTRSKSVRQAVETVGKKKRDSQPRATAAVKAPRTRQAVKVKATSTVKKVRGGAVRPTAVKSRSKSVHQAVEVASAVRAARGSAVRQADEAAAEKSVWKWWDVVSAKEKEELVRTGLEKHKGEPKKKGLSVFQPTVQCIEQDLRASIPDLVWKRRSRTTRTQAERENLEALNLMKHLAKEPHKTEEERMNCIFCMRTRRMYTELWQTEFIGTGVDRDAIVFVSAKCLCSLKTTHCLGCVLKITKITFLEAGQANAKPTAATPSTAHERRTSPRKPLPRRCRRVLQAMSEPVEDSAQRAPEVPKAIRALQFPPMDPMTEGPSRWMPPQPELAAPSAAAPHGYSSHASESLRTNTRSSDQLNPYLTPHRPRDLYMQAYNQNLYPPMLPNPPLVANDYFGTARVPPSQVFPRAARQLHLSPYAVHANQQVAAPVAAPTVQRSEGSIAGVSISGSHNTLTLTNCRCHGQNASG